MRQARRLRALLALLLGVGLALTACPAQRRTLSREDLLRSLQAEGEEVEPPPPALADIQALRVPAPAPLPRALAEAPKAQRPIDEARLAIAVGGDIERAEAAWAKAEEVSRKEAIDLYAHRCLVEEALRRDPPLPQACARFLSLAPDDPRAPAVLAVLLGARSATREVERALLEQGPGWLESCRNKRRPGASCADLAYLLGDALAQAYARRKEEARAKEAVELQGLLIEARIEGPFQDGPLFAHGVRLDGALRPLLGRTFESTRKRWNGRFSPAARGAFGLYRLVFDVEGGGAATVFVTSRVALELRVDGELLLARRPFVHEVPVVSRVGVELLPGRHRVELLVLSRGGHDEISVAALDEAGRPALKAPPASSPPVGLAGAKGRAPLSGTLEDVRAVPWASDDLAALDRHLLAFALGHAGFGVSRAEQRERTRRLLSTYGYAPQVLVATANAIEGDDAVPARLATADAAPLWARVLAVWPDHPAALLSRARMLEEERPEEALAAFRALVRAHPRYPFGWRDLAAAALRRGILDEALEAARALLSLERSWENVDAALEVLRRAGHLEEAAALEAERARHDAGLYATGWARYLLDAGRTREAIEELTRLCDADPGHPAEELLLDLLALDDPKAALLRVERLLVRFPNDVESLRKRAALLHRIEGREAALAAVREALGRFGADEQLLSLSEELGGEPLWAPRLEEGDALVEARRALEAPPFPGHGVVMLLDHVERHLMADLSSVRVRHWIAELRSKAALDGFGEIRILPAERLLRLRVIKPDGRILEPEHLAGVEDISLTGLSLGDIIELVAVAHDESGSAGGLAFETFTFERHAPAVRRSYFLTFPSALESDPAFKILRRGDAPEPVRKEIEPGRVELRFEANDVPGRLDEPHAPLAEEYAPIVGYAYATDLDRWAFTRGRRLAKSARVEPWLEEAARRIAGEGPAKERFERLFRFVVTRIDPAGAPSEAARVLATGRGDRLALLLALSTAAGLDVEPIALHAPVAPPLEVPTANAFGALGLRARIDGVERYAFVDGQLAVLDALPPLMRGAKVLDLTLDRLRGEERLSTLPESAISTRAARLQLDLEWRAPSKLEGFLALTIPAYLSDPVRRALRKATPRQLHALFEQGLAESLPGVRVKSVTIPHLERAGRPLGIGVSIEVPASAEGVEPVRFERLFAHGATGPFGLFTPLSSYLRVAEREQPLLVIAAREELELELTLPPGAAFIEAPEKLEARAGPFRLMQRAAVTDGTLYWQRHLEADTARVPPSRWRVLREQLSSLAGRTEARIAFVVPSQ